MKLSMLNELNEHNEHKYFCCMECEKHCTELYFQYFTDFLREGVKYGQ
jgi:hypothetical protein